MGSKDICIFFRNDDVRGTLDQSMKDLTSLCISQNIPIAHAVEPANISTEVAGWLIGIKSQFPGLIEIIQHGYNHNLSRQHQKMEFGGKRGFRDQLEDIEKGKKIMDDIFGNLWYPVFTFPFGTYNRQTLHAIDHLGYKAISSKITFTARAELKNKIGRLLGADLLFGKKISHHPGVRKGYGFREISVSANLIKKYTSESEAVHFSIDEMMEQIRLSSMHTNLVGVLFHHRFHKLQLELINDLISQLKEKKYRFTTFRNILE